MIVVDASLVVDYLLTVGERTDLAELFSVQDKLLAPSLMPYEVISVLRRHCLSGELTDERAAICISSLENMDIEEHEVRQLRARAWALRQNITFYDAVYVALAELMDVPLYTADLRLAAASGHHAKIFALPRPRAVVPHD